MNMQASGSMDGCAVTSFDEKSGTYYCLSKSSIRTIYQNLREQNFPAIYKESSSGITLTMAGSNSAKDLDHGELIKVSVNTKGEISLKHSAVSHEKYTDSEGQKNTRAVPKVKKDLSAQPWEENTVIGLYQYLSSQFVRFYNVDPVMAKKLIHDNRALGQFETMGERASPT